MDSSKKNSSKNEAAYEQVKSQVRNSPINQYTEKSGFNANMKEINNNIQNNNRIIISNTFNKNAKSLEDSTGLNIADEDNTGHNKINNINKNNNTSFTKIQNIHGDYSANNAFYSSDLNTYEKNFVINPDEMTFNANNKIDKPNEINNQNNGTNNNSYIPDILSQMKLISEKQNFILEKMKKIEENTGRQFYDISAKIEKLENFVYQNLATRLVNNDNSNLGNENNRMNSIHSYSTHNSNNNNCNYNENLNSAHGNQHSNTMQHNNQNNNNPYSNYNYNISFGNRNNSNGNIKYPGSEKPNKSNSLNARQNMNPFQNHLYNSKKYKYYYNINFANIFSFCFYYRAML